MNARALLHDRVVVDRWTGEVTASLRSVVEQLVATRVVAVETLLSTAISERDDAENARVADQVSIIDGELREHAVAAARAAACVTGRCRRCGPHLRRCVQNSASRVRPQQACSEASESLL